MTPIRLEVDDDTVDGIRAALAGVGHNDLAGLAQALEAFAIRPELNDEFCQMVNNLPGMALGMKALVAVELGTHAALSLEPHRRATLALFIAMSVLAKAATAQAVELMEAPRT